MINTDAYTCVNVYENYQGSIIKLDITKGHNSVKM